ncbi:MAG: argininosuccinate lyase, partial [bacterium]|nr:argininosuccinate lyase [bacterium]
KNEDFFNLSLETLQGFSTVFEPDITEVLNPESSTERKKSKGSTAKAEILEQIKVLKKELAG